MKKVLILSLALVLLLGVAANGTFGLFSDAETSTGNAFTAWVEICPPGSMVIVSDMNTMVTGVNNDPITPQNAVYAQHPPGAGRDWDDRITYDGNHYTFPDNAQWIWETHRTDEPGSWAPRTGRVVRFERSFTIPCSPVGATLYMTVDNGYTVWINGHLVGCSQVDPCEGWENYDLTEAHVHTDGWSTVEHYLIPASYLVAGENENVLVILAANEYMGPDDGQNWGTWDSNPAGLIYWLEVEWGG